MKINLRVLAAASVLAVVGAAANAASFSFTDKDRYASAGDVIEMTDGHLTMEVSGVFAKNTKHGTWYYDSSVKTNEDYGLSVGSHYINGGCIGSKCTKTYDEFAAFEFNHAVALKGFGANYVNWWDDFTVYALVDGSAQHIAGGELEKWNPLHTIASTKFWIGTVDKWDKYKITSIHVDKVSEVPLPAGAVLLLSGLGFLALRRRKS